MLHIPISLLILDRRIQFWRIPGKITNTYYWMIRMGWNSPLNRGTVYAIISKNQDHQNQTYASTMHWSPWQFDFSLSKCHFSVYSSSLSFSFFSPHIKYFKLLLSLAISSTNFTTYRFFFNILTSSSRQWINCIFILFFPVCQIILHYKVFARCSRN